MKFFSACVVFAAFAAAAAPAWADPLVSTTESTLGGEFVRLIEIQVLIRTVETTNHEDLLPALNDISRELHQGSDSDIFKISGIIDKTLVDMNMKLGQISRNAISIRLQIESAAHIISTLHSNNARLDYNMQRNRIKKLCEDTLAMTDVVLRFIDETTEMLGKGVSSPLKMLQHMIQRTSDDRLVRERANIQQQQNIVINPPRKLLFFTDHEAVDVAESRKRLGVSTVNRIETLVTRILNRTKWLEGICKTIREQLNNERIHIEEGLNRKIKDARKIINAVTDEIDMLADSQEMSDEILREGSENLVHVINDLRDEVSTITRIRLRRAAETFYDAATESYQIATEHSPPTIFLDQPRPSWLDKKPDNRCFYIYNNRTTGCIFVKTFNFMKGQYMWLSSKFLDFVTLFRIYEKEIENLGSQVLEVAKNSSNQFEAAKLIADLDTKKLLWSDDIKKIRDLFVSLNSYAESLFSEGNAQLKITRSNDDTLNAGIMRAIDENTNTSMDILNKNEDDILVIDNLVGVIVCRFYNCQD